MNVIVDDRDPLIRYTPAWNLTDSRNNPLEMQVDYNSTTSMPTDKGAELSFAFNGTQVFVYATLSSTLSNTVVRIDEGPAQPILPSTTVPRESPNHQLVFNSMLLSDGPHTVKIINLAVKSTLNLDYLMYTISTRAPGQTIFVDDADSSVEYSRRGWSVTNNDASNAGLLFQNTSHLSSTPGAWAAIMFDFAEGDRLILRGPLIPSPSGDKSISAALVTVDGVQAGLVQLQMPTEPGTTTFNNVLFTSDALSAGNHTFNFTYAEGSTSLVIDYFLVLPVSSNAFSTPSSGQPTPLPSATTSAGPASAANPSGGRRTSSRIAIIASGVISGTMFVLLLLLAAFLWRRRRRRRRRAEMENDDSEVPAAETLPPRDSMATLAEIAVDGPGDEKEEVEEEQIKGRPRSRGELSTVDASVGVSLEDLDNALFVERVPWPLRRANHDGNSPTHSHPPASSLPHLAKCGRRRRRVIHCASKKTRLLVFSRTLEEHPPSPSSKIRRPTALTM
ncbi:hypothetical protein C8F01DRAFT_1376020 [Mycena amicta]|nr:hypothetical protein C8F01DRAFT_1376020 [Mycena amicta]